MVDRRVDLQVVIGAERTGAIDGQRLQQRRAGPHVEVGRQVFLDEREETGDGRRGHARARFVAIVGLERRVELPEHVEIITHVVRDGEQQDEIVVRAGRVVRVANRVKKQTALQRRRRVRIQRDRIGAQRGRHRWRAIRRVQKQSQVRRRERVGHREDRETDRVGRNDERENTRAVYADGQIVVLKHERVRGPVWLIVSTAPRRDEHRPRRDHVRLETPERPFDADAHIAARGIARDLVVRIGHSGPRVIGLAHDVRRSEIGDGHAAVNSVRDVPRQIAPAHRDHVLARRRRNHAAGNAIQSIVPAAPLFARREDISHLLLPRHPGQ